MTQLKERYPEMASIHLIEPRVCWPEDREAQEGEVWKALCKFIVMYP